MHWPTCSARPLFPRGQLMSYERAQLLAQYGSRLNRERDEALQQQRATAEVLKVISRSTFDLRVVFETLVESAAKLCEADFANIWRPHGSSYRVAATCQTAAAHKEYLANLSIEPSMRADFSPCFVAMPTTLFGEE